MEARITARDIACRRGDRLLLRGIGFSLEAGQALHLAGANGIGKSSLIRILAGLMQPFAGTVERTGKVALLDERIALDMNLPLAGALGFWAQLDGQEAALAPMGLEPLADVPVRYLSTGQKKRAMMARVLAKPASLWMLDEPLSGLDETARARIDELVAGHCASGGIAIIASHQPFAMPMQVLDLAEYAA